MHFFQRLIKSNSHFSSSNRRTQANKITLSSLSLFIYQKRSLNDSSISETSSSATPSDSKPPQDRRRVVVTGFGAITPLGVSTLYSWNKLCLGASGVSKAGIPGMKVIRSMKNVIRRNLTKV